MAKKKYNTFQVVFKEKDSDVLEWVREQAVKEDRSISNYIVTKLKEIKDKV